MDKPKGIKKNYIQTNSSQVMNRIAGRKDRANFVVKQMFRVPNNEEGHRFIEQVREYANTETYVVRIRSRSTILVKGKKVRKSISERKRDAQWFGVYLVMKPELKKAINGEGE